MLNERLGGIIIIIAYDNDGLMSSNNNELAFTNSCILWFFFLLLCNIIRYNNVPPNLCIVLQYIIIFVAHFSLSFIINKRTNREKIISKVELSKRLIKNIYGNDFFSIGSFIYYKTQAEMYCKWIRLLYDELCHLNPS